MKISLLKKRIILFLTIILTLTIWTNCTEAAGKMKISGVPKHCCVGSSFTLKVSGAGKQKVTWKSSNPKKVTVSKKGKVTIKDELGAHATIYAKVGKKKLKSIYKCF